MDVDPLYVSISVINQLANLLPSALSYVGQGMIMGIRSGWSMCFGMVIGWAFLGPMAVCLGWASTDMSDWETSGRGYMQEVRVVLSKTRWILWISLAIMMGDTVMSLLILIVSSFPKASVHFLRMCCLHLVVLSCALQSLLFLRGLCEILHLSKSCSSQKTL